MTGGPDHVVLSPHPDDAVWSSGGRIAHWHRNGESVVVVTVFDGNAAVPGNDSWRRVADPAMRRHEDAAALERLHASRLSMGLVDAALRVGADGEPVYPTPRSLFTRSIARESEVVSQITERLRDLLGTARNVHVPLALGSHVDHQLVHEAVAALDLERVSWYADFPFTPRRSSPPGMAVRCDAVDVGAWIEAASLYRSQVATLLGSGDALARLILGRARDHPLECGRPLAERVFATTSAT